MPNGNGSVNLNTPTMVIVKWIVAAAVLLSPLGVTISIIQPVQKWQQEHSAEIHIQSQTIQRFEDMIDNVRLSDARNEERLKSIADELARLRQTNDQLRRDLLQHRDRSEQ